jgi:hypothetical protein
VLLSNVFVYNRVRITTTFGAPSSRRSQYV